MNIRIQAINFNADEKLEQFTEKKIHKLEKFHDTIEAVDVYLKVVKPETAENKEVEITVMVANAKFFASKVCNSFEESVDLACEAIEKQIKKAKERK